MAIYDEFVALGNGGYSSFDSERALNTPFALRAEGHVMAWRYRKYFDMSGGVHFDESGDAIQFWTVELRESSEESAAVLFRQRVVLKVHFELDEFSNPESYTLTATVTTTIIGGVTIAAADAPDYLDAGETVEFQITDEYADLGDAFVEGFFNSGAYFVDVPPGAVFAITEVSADGTQFDFELFQRNAFTPPFCGTAAGFFYGAYREAGNGYNWRVRTLGDTWQELKSPPVVISGVLSSFSETPQSYLLLAHRFADYDQPTNAKNLVNNALGGEIGSEAMWDSEYRFVAATQTQDGGIVTCATRGRQFGEAASTPSALWFRQTTFTSGAAAKGWSTPVKIADLETFEPFNIWQEWTRHGARIIATNARDKTFASTDFGATWTEL